MHEMAIAMQIVSIAEGSIPEHLAKVRVKTVNMRVGKLSAIVVDSLQFCYEIAARETTLAGSRLHVTEVPIRAQCKACGGEWTLGAPAFSCPRCGSGDTFLLSGRELDVYSIEFSEEDI